MFCVMHCDKDPITRFACHGPWHVNTTVITCRSALSRDIVTIVKRVPVLRVRYLLVPSFQYNVQQRRAGLTTLQGEAERMRH